MSRRDCAAATCRCCGAKWPCPMAGLGYSRSFLPGDPHYFKDGNGLHPRWRFFFKWPKQYLWMVSPRWFKSLRYAVQRRRRAY